MDNFHDSIVGVIYFATVALLIRRELRDVRDKNVLYNVRNIYTCS